MRVNSIKNTPIQNNGTIAPTFTATPKQILEAIESPEARKILNTDKLEFLKYVAENFRQLEKKICRPFHYGLTPFNGLSFFTKRIKMQEGITFGEFDKLLNRRSQDFLGQKISFNDYVRGYLYKLGVPRPNTIELNPEHVSSLNLLQKAAIVVRSLV